MSDIERRMSEAAIPTKSPVSALHFFGTIMPKNSKGKNKNLRCTKYESSAVEL